MRRLIALVIAMMLAALPALVIEAPAATHAAPIYNVTFTGRLVAAPRTTDLSQPVNLLVQIERRTILVQVTAGTQIIDRNSMPIALSVLRDRAQLQVSGKYNRLMVVATRIRDLSVVSSIPLQLKGQLGVQPVAGSNLLCVANASVTAAATPQNRAQTVASCPAGQLPIVLTGDTRIRNAADGAAALGDLRVGDSLTIAGRYNGVVIFGLIIKDLSLQPLLSVQVSGQLGALPVAGSNLLCLVNAGISGAATPQIRAQTASLCPAGQLPVALTGGTRIRNASDAAAALGDLRVGDNLSIAGSYNGSQITATVIKDASLQAGQVTLTGSLVATPQSTNLAQPLSLLLQVDAKTVLVQVNAQTQLIDRLSNPLTLASLQTGAVLKVTGSYNGVILVATQIQDQSLPAVSVQAKGQLVMAASVGASLLCLADSVVTGAVMPQAQAQTASACPAGQLPVFLTANTQYFSSTGVAIPVTALRPGDLLQVSGVLAADQFTASVIIDTSL